MKKSLSLLLFTAFLFLNLTVEEREPYNISIMASGEYAMGNDTSQFSFVHDFQWFELEQDSIGNFRFEKAEVGIDVLYNECLMDTVTTVYASSDVVFCGELLSERRVVTHALPQQEFIIPIGTQYPLIFNGKPYTLRAEGTILEDVQEDGYSWDHIKDYKLYISNGKTEQLFFTQENFHNTRAEILFIGDMDQDGLPDILISNPRDYETYSVVLYLSTHAKDDELVGNATSTGYDFSC